MMALDFSDYIAERTRDFTGRESVLAEIERWPAKPQAQAASDAYNVRDDALYEERLLALALDDDTVTDALLGRLLDVEA